ncbi:hypothetical protein EIP75_21110 [Aquabacterium soli]|jgi:hypothetical protein|uniref:Uncharacterized protein n=1 Tax=Aquabacterium soli TaxID=2493092 RepID=A0A426V609_9BURK|nr:hypothetical protein [Aquabacterium soli]RRS02359.1 hypothetical protein EIP75_21110 [Aquabacterium soli]
MPRTKPSQHAQVRIDNVVWLNEAARRMPRPGAPPHAGAQDARLRSVLTAVAGLDALEMALLGLCPDGSRDHRRLVQARMAAARSRQALHGAMPTLAALEVMEILHVVGTVRGATTLRAKAPDRARMQFRTMESRWFSRARWGTAALVTVLMSIQCVVAVRGGGTHAWSARPLMASFPANVPVMPGDARQHVGRPRHTEIPRP